MFLAPNKIYIFLPRGLFSAFFLGLLLFSRLLTFVSFCFFDLLNFCQENILCVSCYRLGRGAVDICKPFLLYSANSCIMRCVPYCLWPRQTCVWSCLAFFKSLFWEIEEKNIPNVDIYALIPDKYHTLQTG
jgi:hypothetical protein